VFRIGTHADPAFLVEMLYEAVYWRDDGADERPPLDELLNDPHHACYVRDWGRAGDTAVVAFDRADEPVGAAWYRRFSENDAGYGFVAEDVPELAIAVFPEFRRAGVGSLLLGALVARARSNGERGLSLSVERDNPAAQLYGRHGFVVQNQGDGADTMLLALSSD
jgi:ribosomal protein S18 acetylase RimI-like enzyme